MNVIETFSEHDELCFELVINGAESNRIFFSPAGEHDESVINTD